MTPTKSSPAPPAPATVTPAAATRARAHRRGDEHCGQRPTGQGFVGARPAVLAEREHGDTTGPAGIELAMAVRPPSRR